MNYNQNYETPLFSVGEVQSGEGTGLLSVKQKGESHSLGSIPSGQRISNGENVLILNIGDDQRIILGDAGYD